MLKLTFILLLLVVPVTALAEETKEQSEYEREALRLKYSMFSTTIVQGADSEKLAGMGMFGGDVDFLSQRDDEIGERFRSYRSKKTTSGLLYVTSLLALTGAFLVAAGDDYGDNGGTVTALFCGSLGFLIGGTAVDVSSRESLSQAIWMYNGMLETDPAMPVLSPGEDNEKIREEDVVR